MHPKTQETLEIFDQIAAIPRPSKNEGEITRWLIRWAEEHGFASRTDPAGNLVIQVPASQGCEQLPVLVLQGHLDMVYVKLPGSEHNFDRDPIRPILDGDWLKAQGTTLGADNGIGIALALVLAKDPALSHPPLELLFTVDEEVGMHGARKLDPRLVSGKNLVNLDSEEEGAFFIGCAGGNTTHISLPLSFDELAGESKFYRLGVTGLQGGHSGVDIHKHRANAIQLLARGIDHLQRFIPLQLGSIQGGSAQNAIPADAWARLACAPQDHGLILEQLKDFEQMVRRENAAVEKQLALTLVEDDTLPERQVISAADTQKAINLILALPHGVVEMSAEIEDFVETSTNLAAVEIQERSLHILTSQRSSVVSRLDELNRRIAAMVDLAGGSVLRTDENPVWQPDSSSPLLQRCIEVYRRVFEQEPQVKAIHAGLECGFFSERMPGMDMVSLGMTLKDAHSPQERVYVPSIEKVWKFMVELLKDRNLLAGLLG